MAKFVVLAGFTDQGIRNVKELIEKLGDEVFSRRRASKKSIILLRLKFPGEHARPGSSVLPSTTSRMPSRKPSIHSETVERLPQR